MSPAVTAATADCWDNTSVGALDSVYATRPVSLAEVIPGRPVETAHGTCYRTGADYPLTLHYAGRPLERVLGIPGGSLAALGRDRNLEGLGLKEACFIDTETTGLAGGAGTYVFLVGLGRFTGDCFRVDQYFLEDFDREAAFVAALDEAFAGCKAVVSFNGRGLDLPCLETRFILCRRRAPLAGRPHLDLLGVARRLWRARLPDCRLSTLERTILGEERTDDIPGRFIPELYFNYLRTRDARLLTGVFEHNRRDVLALVGLTARAADMFEAFLGDPPGNGNEESEEVQALDLYALARLYRDTGRLQAAVRCYRSALATGLPEPLADQAALQCVRLLRRLGRYQQAAALCEEFADSFPRRPWAFIELAKDYEHRLRDYDRALAVVDRALGLFPASAAAEFEHRRRRLLLKQSRRVIPPLLHE